ncbi:MAG: TrkA family potassium uptake protein [Dehalococcoidia bacterium]|nr:MAG: TrkA family potassium uptake protein [Dehalococcoidia bacterium]
MYIIVVGGGRVGYYLTKALLDEGHEVLIIEKNATICKSIDDEMGNVCFRGDGCETANLTEVGTNRADMFIAVTGDDEDNLVACQVAKHKFNVPRTIARIRNPANEIIFKKLGIDVTVSSTNIILEHIEEEVPTHPLTHLLTIRDKGLEIVEVKIPADAATVGKTVGELSLPEESTLFLLLRKQQKPIIPKANTTLQAEDKIIAVTTPESEEALRAALSGTK